MPVKTVIALTLALVLMLGACDTGGIPARDGGGESGSVGSAESGIPAPPEDPSGQAPDESSGGTASEEEANTEMELTIGNTPVEVEWENNDSVRALRDLCAEDPLEIRMRMYGGNEQVGEIGADLPRQDSQTTTRAGDIVLYMGNQIVVFYGENRWSYTRLGHITDLSGQQMADLLGHGDVLLTLTSTENPK